MRLVRLPYFLGNFASRLKRDKNHVREHNLNDSDFDSGSLRAVSDSFEIPRPGTCGDTAASGFKRTRLVASYHPARHRLAEVNGQGAANHLENRTTRSYGVFAITRAIPGAGWSIRAALCDPPPGGVAQGPRSLLVARTPSGAFLDAFDGRSL